MKAGKSAGCFSRDTGQSAWHEVKNHASVFFFDVNLYSVASVARRKMLSIAASIFDPLGLLNPMSLLRKLLLQDATRMRMNWDDEVPDVIKMNGLSG